MCDNGLFAEAEMVYLEQGFTDLEDRPRWNDTSGVELGYLRTADDENVPEDVEKKPAHWAVYLTEEYAYFDAETGDPVDDDDVDDQTRYNTEREAAEGLRHYSTVTEKTIVVPEWFCLWPTPNRLASGGSQRAQLYLDLAAWAQDDPARWAPWVAPSPIGNRELRVLAPRRRRRQIAEMNARTRALSPVLPHLISSLAAQLRWAEQNNDSQQPHPQTRTQPSWWQTSNGARVPDRIAAGARLLTTTSPRSTETGGVLI